MSKSAQIIKDFGEVNTSFVNAPGNSLTIRATNNINIADDIGTDNVNIGTGSIARTITIGNNTGATGIVLTTGTGSITVPSSNITQITSLSTAVTTNSVSGIITTVSATLAALATGTFTVNNSYVKSTSRVFVSINNYSGTYTTNGLPVANINAVTNGTFNVEIFNVHATNALSGTLAISYLVLN